MPDATHPNLSGLSFEEALRELETIVRKLESGNAGLEASISDYARGTALKQHCEQKLAEAKLKVEAIVKQSDGTLGTRTFDEAAS